MPLYRLKDYYPNYRETVADGQMEKISSYSVYTQGEDKVGTVKDLLVDDSGRFRYAVIDTGPWIFGKNVLLPIGLARFDYDATRLYVDGLSKSQVENLPEYDGHTVVDTDYESRVRRSYEPVAQGRSNRQFLGNNYIPTNTAENMRPLEGDLRRMPPVGSNVRSAEAVGAKSREGDLRRMGPLDSRDRTDRTPVETTHRSTARSPQAQGSASGQGTMSSPHNPYDYDREPNYYGLSEEDNQGRLRAYEDQLRASRDRYSRDRSPQNN